jgi:hypothetical protein
MNEQIIELADKAVEDISSGPWNISDEFCIKFARLIVQECINTVLDSSVEYCTRPQIVNEIKEHFGVEE